MNQALVVLHPNSWNGDMKKPHLLEVLVSTVLSTGAPGTTAEGGCWGGNGRQINR